ncbi:unnamed protein product, partial [Sphacelaria rigidula]
ATVYFTNDKTDEYLFHELTLTATAPGIQETLEFEGSVRSVTRRLITVANPLGPNEPITFPTTPTDNPTTTTTNNNNNVGGEAALA